MTRLIILIAGVATMTAVLMIAGCSDAYRYPCQDPANQASTDCNPPVCVADGTCTEYLIEVHK